MVGDEGYVVSFVNMHECFMWSVSHSPQCSATLPLTLQLHLGYFLVQSALYTIHYEPS